MQIDVDFSNFHKIGLAGHRKNHTFVRLVKLFKFGHYLEISKQPVLN